MNNVSKVGFTCGAFDLCHAGHILMFEECKLHCDHLIVGLQTNPNLDRHDKRVPIQTVEERKIILSGVKYIDEIIVYDTERNLYELLNSLQKAHQDLVRFVGADWKGKKFTGYNLDILVHFNSRDHTYSSTELVERIRKVGEPYV